MVLRQAQQPAEISARRRRIQSGPGLQPGQETRFVLFRETMIRHAVLSGTITAISVGVHGATARSCLIASPSFPLSKWATASHPSELENSWSISERVSELLAERDAANLMKL